MVLIKGLYTVLIFVTGINVIASLYDFWSQGNSHVSEETELARSRTVWTWKDTVWLILMILAIIFLVSITLLSFAICKIRFLMSIITISYILRQIARAFPSAEMVGNIVSGKTSKILGVNEYTAIITLALVVTYFDAYGALDKAVEYANGQTNSILSDWMLLGFYVASIAITTFFICSLALRPVKIIIELLRKIFFYIGNRKEGTSINWLKKQTNNVFITKTWTSSWIEYSMKQHYIFCFFLWSVVPIAFVFDIFQMTILLVCEFVVSTIWCLMYIAIFVKKIFSQMGTRILSLSDRNVVAISFRIAIIFGFGCTVIINQYEPFLRNQGSTSVFEFISSTIMIPIILEWILSYKTELKNNQ